MTIVALWINFQGGPEVCSVLKDDGNLERRSNIIALDKLAINCRTRFTFITSNETSLMQNSTGNCLIISRTWIPEERKEILYLDREGIISKVYLKIPVRINLLSISPLDISLISQFNNPPPFPSSGFNDPNRNGNCSISISLIISNCIKFHACYNVQF